MTWEIAPLRAAALRTERAVNKRWQTLRAAIIGGSVLLGVIGSAAALSLSTSSVPGGMGFLSAASFETSSSATEHDVTASEARDGVTDQGAPPATTEPTPPAEEDVTPAESTTADSAPAATQPEAPRGTPTANPEPLPQPGPVTAPAPEPTPTPTTPSAPAADDNGGLLGDLLDLLLPGLLP